jgi:hypothetical protein
MKNKTILYLLGSIVIIGAAILLFSQSPLQSIFAKGAVAEPVAVLLPVEDTANAADNELVSDAEAEAVDPVTFPTVLLTVLKDEVNYFDKSVAKFVLIETETIDLQQDDCVRTGKEGLAEIVFTDDLTLNLEPNTEICLVKFAPDEEDDTLTKLTVSLSIGEAFFNINDPDETWDVSLLTPNSYVWSDELAFSYTAQTIYPGTEDLTPEELEDFIRKYPPLNPKTICNRDDGSKYFCNGCVTCSLLINSNPVKVIVLAKTGIVNVTYLQIPDGLLTSELQPGKQFEYSFPGYEDEELWRLFCETMTALANGEEVDDAIIERLIKPEPGPRPTIVVPQPCGDGVCDIYGGENAENCPIDCK